MPKGVFGDDVLEDASALDAPTGKLVQNAIPVTGWAEFGRHYSEINGVDEVVAGQLAMAKTDAEEMLSVRSMDKVGSEDPLCSISPVGHAIACRLGHRIGQLNRFYNVFENDILGFEFIAMSEPKMEIETEGPREQIEIGDLDGRDASIDDLRPV